MIWIALITLIISFLGFDMLFLHQKGKPINNTRVAIETLFWVSIAMGFSFMVYVIYENGWVANATDLPPRDAVIKYITGYLIELSLSVDNLFVIAMIFASFKIPIQYQHTALFWGILGAIVFRGIMIGLGVVLIQQISWITYLFGAFLLFTAFKMLAEDEGDEPDLSFVNRLSKFIQISPRLEGEKFWTIENGVRVATPLFAALIMIELADLLFALDSIPAILAVTSDPFLVFSSNIFAILGLRSMYFFLANMLERFHYLKYSVFAILVFVSGKLITIHFFKISEVFSLTFIGVSLGLGVLASLYKGNSRTENREKRRENL